MDVVDKLSNLMESYRGHDNSLGLIGYSSTMISGLYSKKNPILSKKFKTIANEISNARVILRLLDDFSMLSYTYSYGLGKHVCKSHFYQDI